MDTNCNLVVADLIDPLSAEWNLQAIRLHLPQYEDQIRMLPLSQYSMKDELVWLPERTGEYSTKTGYALSKLNTTDIDPSFNWKKLVWGVKTSPKLKHFLWKIKNTALPLGANLIRRGIEVDGVCKRCGIIETERHLFFQCPFATRVWNLIPAMSIPRPSSISTPASFLTACERMTNLPPSGLHSATLYPWVFWYLWSARNKLLFENLTLTEQEVATFATKEARSWQAAQGGPVTKPPPAAPIRLPQDCGSIEYTNMFVDAAWNATTRGGGFGCIIKDHHNITTVHQKSSNCCIVGSAFVAEAIAVKRGLLEAIHLGLRTLTVWSDSQALVNIISLKKKSTEAQGVLFDIDHLCSFFSSISFQFVPRLKNTNADALAKLGLLNLAHLV